MRPVAASPSLFAIELLATKTPHRRRLRPSDRSCPLEVREILWDLPESFQDHGIVEFANIRIAAAGYHGQKEIPADVLAQFRAQNIGPRGAMGFGEVLR